MIETQDSRLKRGIYLLPNLFTTAALFSGYYAIVAAMKGQFDMAAVAIFIAMLMDSLDGRVARLTNTQSAFGAQYDSISDVVAFGLAPALVVYNWSLYSLGKVGWLIAFVYTAATALRLARFNVQLEGGDKRYFIGLPCPSAAGILAGLVWLGGEFSLHGVNMAYFVLVLTFLVAAAMVSNILYPSFKEVDLKGKVSFMAVLMVVLIFVAIAVNPPTMLFTVFFGYGLYGALHSLWRRYFKA